MSKAGEGNKASLFVQNAMIAAAIAAFGAAAVPASRASVYYWDADGDTTASTGGVGIWDTNSSLWRADSSTGTLGVWSNTDVDQAVFEGTAGIITLNSDSTPIVANKLTFSVTGYTIGAPSSGTASLVLSGTTPTIEVTTASHTATISALLTGSGSLAKSGAGTLELFGANTYSGGTTLSAGTLRLAGVGTASAGALGTGTLTVAGNSTITESTTATTIYNNINIQSGVTLTLSAANADQYFAGNVSGSGSISTVASGSAYYGTFLSGDNSAFTGTLTTSSASRSRFKFASATAGSASAAWVLNNANNGAIALTFGNGTLELGELSGNGYIRSEAASASTSILKIGGKGTDSIFAGRIQANSTKVISVTKVGSGTLTLTNTSNYTGDTTISGGTLLLSNASAITSSSSFTINGGTLASNVANTTLGAGAVTMTSGALHANQNNVGSFVIATGKNVSLAGGTLYETIASNSSYDTLTTAAGSTGTFALSNVTLDLSCSTGIDYTATYAIFTNFASGSVSNVTIVGYDSGNYLADLNSAGVLSFTAVPEPGSISLLTLAGLGFILRRRQK